MRFYSKSSNLRVQLWPGGLKPNPEVPGAYNEQPGLYAQFEGGQFDLDALRLSPEVTEQAMAKLRSHPNYGYGKVFWCEIDKPASVTLDEEMARLRAENAALKKATGLGVVVVERPATKDESAHVETGLAKLNRLKQEAAAKGLQPERSWKAEDYERALLAVSKEG